MKVTEKGATLEFDCAHGSIAERVVLDGDGKFSVKGRYVRERPGPVHEGADQSGEPAVFSGSVVGKTLTLRIKLEGSSEEISAFTLVYGKAGRIVKCL